MQTLLDQPYNTRGRLSFHGAASANLFTREIEESFQGVLARNLVSDPQNAMVGFVSASIDGRPWADTMWTRDAGVFLRELVQWGDYEHACLVAQRLIDLVRPNPQGYCTFPMYFTRGVPGSGSELDGTAAILIGMILLWERLPPGHLTRQKIEHLIEGESSPLGYILYRLQNHPLVPGSGEFGGGCGIEGEFYNAVQNNLVRLALLAAGRMQRRRGEAARAQACLRAVDQIAHGMLAHLRWADGGWIWAISPETLQPDPTIVNHVINKGFGGINGILAMSADVEGLTPLDSGWAGYESSLVTFQALLAFPKRQAMFEKYGVWTQFDEFCNGFHTGPSYGHGYATQAMLLMDRLEMAGKAVEFLAEVTLHPFPANILDRDSDHYFYERIYLPELLETPGPIEDWEFNVFDGQKFDQGCGALNLVCVAEPLKIARLIAGVDETDPVQTRLIPRLPPTWEGYVAQDWPIQTSAGLTRVDIHAERRQDKLCIRLSVHAGPSIPSLVVRLPQGDGWVWQRVQDVYQLEIP